MPFSRKIKTKSRLASLNHSISRPDNLTFRNKLNGDTVLKSLQQDMVVMIGAIKNKELGVSGGGISAPKPVPCPIARWEGRLQVDSVTKKAAGAAGNDKDYDVYVYDHKSAFALNAQVFRERIAKIQELERMQNDLTNSYDKPNPGGQAGTHNKNLPNDPS